MSSVRFSVTKIFLRQFKELVATGDSGQTVYQEVQFLLEALTEYGHEIESHDHFAASKPLLSSRPWAVFTLRRTPPTIYTPNATDEPVLRVPYLWFRDTDTGDEIAVVLFIADKSDCEDQDKWYEQLAEQVKTVANQWRKDHPTHRPLSIHAIGKAKDS